MTAKFFALLTNIGAAKLANATALGTRLEITHMAVGDGGGTLPTPNPAQNQLVNEQRRAALNMLTIDPINTSQIIAEQVIPETEGGWWIREIGLLDKDGDLVAIANCAETYKPQLQEGSGRTQTIRMILIVSSTAAVTLKTDPAVVLATRQYADQLISTTVTSISNHIRSQNPHPQYLLTRRNLSDLSNKKAARINLQLGSAATKNVGNNNGNVMEVGAFGWGGTCIATPDGLNALTKTGMYRANRFTPDLPAGFGDATIQHIQNDHLTAHQIIFSTNKTLAKISYRSYRQAQWNEWIDIITSIHESLTPIGIPLPYPGTTPPAGYLKCNGAAFYPYRYPTLATLYPTHKLPDLRGEFIRGFDDGRGIDTNRTLLSAQTDALQNITGGINGVSESMGSAPESNFSGAFGKSPAIGNDNTPHHTDITHCGSFDFDASRVVRTATETRPRNISFCYILRAV
ncbi:phage tail-collar fiber domain-containing protein [Yersinia aldovae]|uniref:phage tail-collar fiber domain-containing protein n=1 Tax=Yersinia aldovae TaxID=29483 RepID=UPI0005ACFA38|nr:phage tail protein [Yersinia aldovae]AJJ64467.1 phage Tail Collar domain protein [Yersinia aldovae 670-83]